MQIIHVPYDSGYKDFRMGRGPSHILRQLKAEKSFPVDQVEVPDQVALEIGTSFAVARQIAEKVRHAIANEKFPLILAGNCISCVGTIAGLGMPSPAIIWLDAHGDFNTPETTISGFLDGMALSTAVGRCWSKLAGTVPGFCPLPERYVVLVGAHEFDANERKLIDNSDVHVAYAEHLRKQGLDAALGPPLAKIRTFTERAYLHIDLDVLDLGEASVNQFSAPAGLNVAELLKVVSLVRERFALIAAAITAYDPECDRDGKAVRAALAVISELAKSSGAANVTIAADRC